LKDIIEKNSTKKRKENPKSVGLTHASHKTMITPYKLNKKNYEAQFSINSMLKERLNKKRTKKLTQMNPS
jgi:hypothetical protein